MAQLLIPHPSPARTRLRPGAVVDIVSPAPRDIWCGVLRDDPGATALQTPDYFDAVLSATRGEDASRLYQLRDGRQLVLPLVRRRTPFGLHRDAGYPGGHGQGSMLATGGLLADDVRAVVRDLRGQSRSIRIGGGHHTSDQWSAGLGAGVAGEGRRVEVLELGPGRSRALRQELDRSARLGVEVEVDTTGRLLPTCYDIYRAGVERSGRPGVRRRVLRPEPYRTFAAVAAGLGERCRVFVGWHRGRPVAATIMLTYGQHAVIWRSCSLHELSAPVNADQLTRVAALEDAVRSGCRYVDLGRPDDQPSLRHVGSRLGAGPRSVVDLRIEPVGLTRLRTARTRAEGVVAQALIRTSADSAPGEH